jgi:hypothetical protein
MQPKPLRISSALELAQLNFTRPSVSELLLASLARIYLPLITLINEMSKLDSAGTIYLVITIMLVSFVVRLCFFSLNRVIWLHTHPDRAFTGQLCSH